MKILARIATPANDVVMEIDTDNVVTCGKSLFLASEADDFPVVSVMSDGGKEIPAIGVGSVEELLLKAAVRA